VDHVFLGLVLPFENPRYRMALLALLVVDL
jgi:hypothetical protein